MKDSDPLLVQALEQASRILAQAAAVLGVGAAPAALPRRDKPGITSRLALSTAAQLGQPPQNFAAALVGAASLGDSWFDVITADRGYINFHLSPLWYRAIPAEVLSRPRPFGLFTPPAVAKSAFLLSPPPEAEALAAYGGYAPSPLQRRDNPPYAIWYAFRRSGQKSSAGSGEDGAIPLEELEGKALFAMAQFPYQYRLAAAEDNPRRLYQGLVHVTGLFEQYDRNAAKPHSLLYRCFEETLCHCLAALGIDWRRGENWCNRMEAL